MNTSPAIDTTHSLEFELGNWDPEGTVIGKLLDVDIPNKQDYSRFRVGTCHGLYGHKKDRIIILAVMNYNKGNGHFEDVLEWFYYACKESEKHLIVQELWNKRLKRHLINKRGFTSYKSDHVIKKFKDL